MPQEQVEIELRYTELLIPTDNVYELVFPTVVGPRYASPQDGKKKEDGFVETPYQHQGQQPPSASFNSCASALISAASEEPIR